MAFPNVVARNALSKLLAEAVNDVVTSHYATMSQEPALSARIGQRAECLSGKSRRGYKLEVISQDIPDRGRRSLERKIGADLFFGIRISGSGQTITKGFLVQAKWDKDLYSRRLIRQCEDMLDRTKDGAYVWSYGSSGVSSIKAQDVLQNAPRPHRPFNGETLDKFFRQVLDCLRGDFDLAPTGIFSDRHKLSEYVNEIGAQTGVAVSVK